jgi:hypothetical protein
MTFPCERIKKIKGRIPTIKSSLQSKKLLPIFNFRSSETIRPIRKPNATRITIFKKANHPAEVFELPKTFRILS